MPLRRAINSGFFQATQAEKLISQDVKLATTPSKGASLILSSSSSPAPLTAGSRAMRPITTIGLGRVERTSVGYPSNRVKALEQP